MGRCALVRCGLLPLRQKHRMLPTVTCMEGWLMQVGNPVPDPVCGRCKQKIEREGLTEAVYQDGLWFHTACHRAGADQLFRATRLADVLKDVTRGVEVITSSLFQGDELLGVHTDEGKRCPFRHR